MHLYQNKKQYILIFGLGLVGKAISNELGKSLELKAARKLNWTSLTDCQKTISEILDTFFKDHINKLTIIWSAGKAGFSATEDQITHDLEFYRLLHDFMGPEVKERFSDCKIDYRLISSAGGLFEGQTAINQESVVEVQRPYGRLKLEQERYIASAEWVDFYSNIRLSSVYTISNTSGRLGLIPTIMKQAIQQKEITVFGAETTLRDYVLDLDIARYVSDHIDAENLPKEVFLIDGKPSTIQEIKIMIERIIGRKIYLKYKLEKTNSSHISYSPNIKPKGFNTSELNANLRLLYNQLLFN